ncbi:MAG: helix-turn-helix transcriptional regulator [Chloroflexota bacterium]|nr:helix-turn-helix transcriptional regulator [Chloroflexota bacterium]
MLKYIQALNTQGLNMTSSESTAPVIEYGLLGLLYQQPQHGYGLFKKIQTNFSLIWRVKLSKLYYLLDKLEDQGLLTPTLVPDDKTPDRKVYHITAEGERVFLDWIQSPVESAREMRISFLARLYFALQIGRNQALTLLAAQDSISQKWLQNLTSQFDEIENQDFITKRVFSYRIGQVQAMLAWLDECKQQIVIEN